MSGSLGAQRSNQRPECNPEDVNSDTRASGHEHGPDSLRMCRLCIYAAGMADVNARDVETLREQLGREPRGVRAIETRCPVGHPQVVRVYPLVDGEPFPTLFWLSCPSLVRQISQLEHQGLVSRLEELVARDDELRARYFDDHRAYIRERWNELSERDRGWIDDQALSDVYHERGIGGILNWASVKCLHLHYAHHLARANVLGAWIDKHYQIDPCQADR